MRTRIVALFVCIAFLSSGALYAMTSQDFNKARGRVVLLTMEDGTELEGIVEKIEDEKVFLWTKEGPREIAVSSAKKGIIKRQRAEEFGKLNAVSRASAEIRPVVDE